VGSGPPSSSVWRAKAPTSRQAWFEVVEAKAVAVGSAIEQPTPKQIRGQPGFQAGRPSTTEMSPAVGTTRVSRKPWAAKSRRYSA
jgi:hypothetical protein